MLEAPTRCSPGCASRLRLRTGVGFHEFDAVPEWVIGVDAVVAVERFVVDKLDVGASEPCDKCWEVAHEKGWVCLLRSAEV